MEPARQLRKASRALNAFLGNKAPDLVCLASSFVDETLSRAMHGLNQLLLGTLDCNTMNCRTACSIADRFGIVLAIAPEKSSILRRNQTHIMAQGNQFSSPIMRTVPSYDPDNAWFKIGKKRARVTPPQLSA